MDELIKNFDEKRISKSSSQYDVKKLKWFNAIYIKNMPDEEYLKWIKNYFTRDVSDKSEEWLNTLLLVYKSHLSYGLEINDLVEPFFNKEFSIDAESREFMSSDEVIPKVIEVFKSEIKNVDNWSIDALTNVINNVKDKALVKGKMLYMPIRIAATGVMHGPELPEVLYLIGKDEILKRLG
jgi:nondiscriminating glutamyl-tRNA synthetase